MIKVTLLYNAPLCTELYKSAWNVLANNSRTVHHTDLKRGKVVYLLIFHNI